MSAAGSRPGDLRRQAELIASLRSPQCYPHPAGSITVIETHISFVLLTGDFAYKIKKPVDLGFLDFTRLDARRRYCEEELRLNRRLSPQLYLDVVPIGGTAGAPRVGGAGETLEYAVKMREFPQEALLDRMLATGMLAPAHIDALAARIAAFHGDIPSASAASGHGTPEAIGQPMRENFAQLRELGCEADPPALDALERWSLAQHARLGPLFERRLGEGFVRECHGDLHLGNIAWVDGAPQVFDCIEFNPEFRWIDTASEIAFLTMDLASRGRPDLAARFLNDYLELGGDYESLRLLRYYQTYRALVRAKVAAIRASQAAGAGRPSGRLIEDCRAHVALARGFTASPRPAIVVMHGVSGSGKSTLAGSLIERLGAVRIRSDVERKRLHGLQARARSGSGLGAGLYGEQQTRETYERLAALAGEIVSAGFVAIVDAANLLRWQRARFERLGGERGCPVLIAACDAAPELLRQRVAARAREGSDASEATLAVLERQIALGEALSPEEERIALRIDTAEADAMGSGIERVARAIGG